MAKQSLAEVAPAVPLGGKTPSTFTYKLPQSESEPKLYSRVQIPFGKRFIPGVVLEIHNRTKPYQLKTISRIFPNQFTTQQIKFAKWLARTHGGGLGFTLRLFFSPRQSQAVPSLGEEKKAEGLTWPHYAYNDTFSNRLSFFIKLIPPLLSKGGQVFLAVPEKHLTSALVSALKQDLSVPVWELTGDTSRKKRAELWTKISQGSSGVVVGTQKAFYLPWRNLRLLVVEEESFSSHKLWDGYPRLDNRVAARSLSQIHHCPLLWSGTIPSVGTTFKQKEGEIISLGLNYPVLDPRLITSDFTDKYRRLSIPGKGINSIKSWLKAEERVFVLVDRLSDGELFLNLVQKFKQKISIIQISAGKEPKQAPNKNYPELFVGTMAALRELADFKLDRVVWLRPERSLSYPDFRSQEQALTTFFRLQELSPPRRKVVLITTRPQAVKNSLVGDLKKIHQQLIRERSSLDYPPFSEMVQLTVSGQAKTAEPKLTRLRAQLEKKARVNKFKVRLLGPYHSLDPKQKNKSYSLLLLGDLVELSQLYQNLTSVMVEVAPKRIL